MNHPSTQPNGECADPGCECHALATKTDEGEYLELQLPAGGSVDVLRLHSNLTGTIEQHVTHAQVRAAIFDVLDAGDGKRDMWMFPQSESDTETSRRVRFVNAVLKRLRELR